MTDYIGVGCLNCLGIWDWDKHTPPDQKCPSCVKPETVIAGDYKRIAELEIGDRVFGVHNALNGVERKFVRQYTGDLVNVKCAGLLPIELTPNHPVLVRTLKRVKDEWTLSDPYWKPVEKLIPKLTGWKGGDYVIVPRLRGITSCARVDLAPYTKGRGLNIARGKGIPTVLPINEDVAWLLGLYVAEGTSDSKGVQFNLGKHELELHENVKRIARRLGYSPCTLMRSTTTVVVIPSRILARAFAAMCGKGAENKRIPKFLLLHKNAQFLRTCLQGYLQGDGGLVKDRHGTRKDRLTAETTSKILASQLQLAYARLGVPLFVRRHHLARKSKIRGRWVEEHESYIVATQIPRTKRNHIKVLPDALICPVRKVGFVPYSGPVHNIETEDNTYLVSNVVVHNCGVATSELNFDEQKLKWTNVIRLFYDPDAVQSFHNQRGGEKKHDKGCRVCRGKRARRLAPLLNTMMRDQKIEEVRRLIQENKDAAPLAISYSKEEFRHMLESILRQEFGIEGKPATQERA